MYEARLFIQRIIKYKDSSVRTKIVLPKIACKFEYKVTPSFPLEYLGEKQERHCRYTLDIEAFTRKHCCSVENSITYYEFGSAAVGIQHAKRMRHIVVCGLSGSTIFLHIIS